MTTIKVPLWVMCIAFTSILRGQEPLFYGDTSDDFIIRWAFQKACQHVFDPRTNRYVWPTSDKRVTFDPEKVRPGDCIFARRVDLFFKELHPHISCPYILVTHGEHLDAVKEEQLPFLDDPKVIAWFGIHPCKKTHPKYRPIPLGILQDPLHYKKKGQLTELFASLRETEKSFLVYMNFADGEKPERQKLKKLLCKEDYCKRGGRKPFFEYLKEMAACKFTLAPRGLGPDSYRVWEALLVGSIPVIKSSSLDPLFKGLPVLIVSDWSVVNEDYLKRNYKKISAKSYNNKRLYMSYWLNKIERVRSQFFTYTDTCRGDQ